MGYCGSEARGIPRSLASDIKESWAIFKAKIESLEGRTAILKKAQLGLMEELPRCLGRVEFCVRWQLKRATAADDLIA